MARYLYNKHNTISTESSQYEMTSESMGNIEAGSVSGYTDYHFNIGTGVYSGSGNYVTIYSSGYETVYQISGSSMGAYSANGYNAFSVRTYSSNYTTITNYSKGTYITTVTAENGTYPTNGRHADGYWYERTILADKPTVTSPNGGENINTTHTITWNVSNSGLKYNIDLSSDNGSTWKTLVNLTDVNITSSVYNFTNETTSSLCRIRIRAFDTTTSIYSDYDLSDGVFTIQHNVAPLSPSNLSPASIIVDRTQVKRFTWQVNDVNSNDLQSAFDLQWGTNGVNWNTISQVTNNNYYDLPANTLPVGTIYWKIRTYDQYGLVSPYSSQVTITVATPSDAPIILQPSGTVSISKPIVQWSSTSQIAYQIIVLNSQGGTHWDTGEVITSNKAVTLGVDLINLNDYTIKVRVKDNNSLWSNYSSLTISVSFIPPMKSKLILSSNSLTGSIDLEITNYVSSDSVITRSGLTLNPLMSYNPTSPTSIDANILITHDIDGIIMNYDTDIQVINSKTITPDYSMINEVYRKKTNESSYTRIAKNIIGTSQYKDYTTQSDRNYDYFIRTFASNGTYTDTEIKQSLLTIRYAFLSLANNPSSYLEIIGNMQIDDDLKLNGGLKQFAGRTKRVSQFGIGVNRDYSLSFVLFNDDISVATQKDKLDELIESRDVLLFRDYYGHKIYCTVFSMQSKYQKEGCYITIPINEISYTEGV